MTTSSGYSATDKFKSVNIFFFAWLYAKLPNLKNTSYTVYTNTKLLKDIINTSLSTHTHTLTILSAIFPAIGADIT